MSGTENLFTDGAAYERRMGRWSRLVGEVFLDWIAAPPALRWIDVGCGRQIFAQPHLASINDNFTPFRKNVWMGSPKRA